jgi:hypothetical protein
MNAMGTRGGLIAAERDASVTLGIECDASATFETGSVAYRGSPVSGRQLLGRRCISVLYAFAQASARYV